jgi:hypothetical protein
MLFFDDIYFSNSRVSSLTIPSKIAADGFNFVMENYYLKVASRSASSPVLHFNPNGKFHFLSGSPTEELQKMYYSCGRENSFVKRLGRNSPFLHHASKIPHPREVVFDEKELPIGFDFPDSL